VELGRELATMLTLGAVALAVARNSRQWLAAFTLVFGVWDLAFYAFLKLTIGWPASLLTWDILFLLPVPWVGPVIAPAIVAASMVAGGIVTLWYGPDESRLRISPVHWAAIIVGGFIVVVAFMWDWRNTIVGNWPNPFNWPLFWTGELLAIGAFSHALKRQRLPR
jgi:hypothetical protein